jgi:o-succinylbenzoate synthase
VRLDAVELLRVRLPLVRPFRTSFALEVDRDVLLARARTAEGVDGWAECVATSWPGYSAEYLDAAIPVMTDHLLPRVWGVSGAEGARTAMAPVRGHPMAKAALETAILDAQLREEERSLASYLGAVRNEVDCGVSVGIPPDDVPDRLGSLLEEVGSYVDAGYRRIKLKIQPGWDLHAVSAVRERWPDIPLQVDANAAYGREHLDYLTGLDAFHLLLVEQPLPEDDLVGHARLAELMRTPVCLDESIISVASAETALAIGAASIINIKPGRVGGYLESLAIHDLCREADVPVWCGGMLETGIGRAANLALAALQGFTLPGDTSASDRYYARDLTEPFVLHDGRLAVPSGPGIGVDPVDLDELVYWRAELRPG